MKKKILKVTVFMLILLLFLMVLSNIVNPKNNTEEAGIKEVNASGILGERENSIDIVVLGDSISTTSIIPMKLWEDYGFTSYICGTSGQSLPDSIKWLHTATEKQKPKIVILEANNIYNDISFVVPIARMVQRALPITEYHDRWKNLNKEDFFGQVNYTFTDFMRGYRYKDAIAPADTNNYMEYTDETLKISLKGRTYLNVINNYCKKIDANFIIVGVPSTKNWNYEKHNGVQNFANKNNIEFLDLNIIANELKIDWNTDTLDNGDHVNYNGAVKITNYLENYLKNKEILTDHRNDEEFKNWDEDLIKYKEVIGQ